jgi:hypothetical protein
MQTIQIIDYLYDKNSSKKLLLMQKRKKKKEEVYYNALYKTNRVNTE